MPGFFKRLWSMVRGKANAALDHLEKPEQQLAVFVDELSGQVRDLQSSVASAIADEKRLKLQMDKQLDQASEWERRAVLALEADDEALAREALDHKSECEEQSLALRGSWEAQKQATEQLKTSLRTARGRIEEAKRKYTLLLAQYRSAQTREKIQDSLATHVDSKSPMALVAQLEDKIQTIEARTEANAVLEQIEDGNLDLEAKFLELEKGTRGDDALVALRERVAETRRLASGEVGSGGPGEAADRVEALKRELDAE